MKKSEFRRPASSAENDADERYADERVNQRARPWVGYFAVALSVAYVGLGIAVALAAPARLPLPPAGRYALGFILIMYGSWRARRAIARYFR